MYPANTLEYIVRRSVERIQCKFCWIELAIKDYYRHLERRHRDQHLTNRCIFCMQFTWKYGDQEHYKHQIFCVKQRISEYNQKFNNPPPTVAETCTGYCEYAKKLNITEEGITEFFTLLDETDKEARHQIKKIRKYQQRISECISNISTCVM